VDAISAVKYVATVALTDSGTTIATLLRAEVLATFKVAPSTADLPQMITDTILKGLSIDLQRKCISFFLATEPTCLCRGFVLDAWGVPPTGLITSAEDMRATLAALEIDEETNTYQYSSQTSRGCVDILVEILVSVVSIAI
jgi:hypothetical protein